VNSQLAPVDVRLIKAQPVEETVADTDMSDATVNHQQHDSANTLG
jgi:hypothetical protein